MNFQKLITDLESVGMSQAEIATQIGVTQGRVNQVKNDDKAGFRGAATVALILIHTQRCPEVQPGTGQAAA